MNELWRASALDLIRLLGAGEVSALEITESVLARIAEVEDRVRAYLTVTPQEARARAKQVDEARRRGETPGPIAGVPVAIKDIICTK
ncbi:MAG: amidase family protein, partial [Actinomycetota bacterium]